MRGMKIVLAALAVISLAAVGALFVVAVIIAVIRREYDDENQSKNA